jgi:hypothetical protein
MAQTRTSNPSQAQIARLYTLAGKASLDHSAVIAQLRGAYNVESTRQLSLPQYEEFCLWIKGRIGARATGEGAPPAREGQLWQRAQVVRILDEELATMVPGGVPAPAEMREHLADVLDDFRLYRGTGRISAALLRALIQQIRRYHPSIITAACEVWLAHYRERNEAYFLGILRRIKRETKNQARTAQRRDTRETETADREREARQEKLVREMEANGWTRIGRMAGGEPVYQFASAIAPQICWVRGGYRRMLPPSQHDQIIRGLDQ